MSFGRSDGDEYVFWKGTPDCQTAHDAVLEWITGLTESNFLSSASEINTNVVGSLGETITAMIGINEEWGIKMFAANALTPLALQSKSEIDIVWVYFGPDERDDFIVVQEVKCTLQNKVDYGLDLAKDIEKLYGFPARLNLPSRLRGIKAKLEFEQGASELCPRLQRLVRAAPSTDTKVRVVGTLVHDGNSEDPLPVLTTVRSRALGLGWGEDSVACWSVSMEDLKDRFDRLAVGAK
ncbi:MAG: hypothetical protein EOP84_03785 [Verrucomicrobiaceae bacterium]|nr:MAG: hypothetical protein EOP84_03785 [Verrucomicrobiaceae bacterium]